MGAHAYNPTYFKAEIGVFWVLLQFRQKDSETLFHKQNSERAEPIPYVVDCLPNKY
jgi:hypothetical protein